MSLSSGQGMFLMYYVLSIILILQVLIGSEECYQKAIMRTPGPIMTCKRISGRKITLPKLEFGQMASSCLGICFANIKIHLYMNCRAHTSFINSPQGAMSWNSWNYADISTLRCRLHCISSKCRQSNSNTLLKAGSLRCQSRVIMHTLQIDRIKC